METITDLLIQADTWRRLRVRQDYSRRIGGTLPEATPASEPAEWPTRETICDLRVLLRTAEPARLLGIRHLLRVLSEEYARRHMRELSDPLLMREQAAVIQVPTADEPIPFWQVSARMAQERKRLTRGLLEEATTTVVRELNKPYRELWSRLYALSEDLGYSSLIAMWEEVSGVPLDDFITLLEAILRETEDTYRDLMHWYLKRAFGITLQAAKRHDILALFSLDELESWFPAADVIPTVERWLGEWGWQFGEHTNLRVEHNAAGGRGPLCAPFDIPQDIRLTLAPTGGLRGFAHALRETGKALLYASLPSDAPPELRCFPDPSLLEAQASMFEGLVRDQHWVEIYRHVGQSGEALRLAQVERLFIMRRSIGKCLYERSLYEDTTLDGKGEPYVDALRRACGFSYPEEYFLYDVEPGFATLWRLRGWVLGAHIRSQLRQRYDVEWFREPDAFEALCELWSHSLPHTVDAIVQQVGGSPMDATPVVADLLSAL